MSTVSTFSLHWSTTGRPSPLEPRVLETSEQKPDNLNDVLSSSSINQVSVKHKAESGYSRLPTRSSSSSKCLSRHLTFKVR